MKLNWLGKAFVGAAGAYAVAKVAESAFGDDSSGELEFDNDEVEALADAARAGNYRLFAQLYRNKRPWADDDNVATSYGDFVRILQG